MKFKILILIFFFASCSTEALKIPKGVIVEEKLIPLLVEVHLSDALATNEKIVDVKILNQVKKLYLENVLEKHDISLTKYEETMAFYKNEPKAFFEIYEKVMIQISSEEAILNGDKEEKE